MGGSPGERERLREAIDSLEAQRPVLGDSVVDAAVEPLLKLLQELPERRTDPRRKLRKLCTVLFADVSGFTSASESTDAETVTEAINALWERLDGVILEHGGYIDKHMGDAVMALWGVEAAREDDPERAIRAALAMQAELEREGRADTSETPGLRVRIGVHTGPVFLSPVGTTGEYTAMGDTVNTASRLQESAPVGGVLVSAACRRHVRGLFQLREVPPLPVKGKSEPLKACEVTRVLPRGLMQANRGVVGIDAPMVGREGELGRLLSTWRRCGEDSRCRAVVLVADAGIGKSRLAAEFRNGLADSGEGMTLLAARCTPDTEQVPRAMLRSMLAFHCDIREDDRLETVREKLVGGLSGHLSETDALLAGRYAGFHAAGEEEEAPADARSGRACLLELLGSLASSERTLLCLEDLHWADASSMELLGELTSLLDGTGTMLLGLARPVFLERFPDWAPERCETLRLRPLSPGESGELVRSILRKLPTLPERVVELVAGGADGNPYYVEELIEMLVDRGVIVRGSDVWELREEPLADCRVPGTLTGVLQARLDSLPERERDLLQKASVVGRDFWDTVLELLSEEEPTALGTDLSSVTRRELVTPRKPSELAGSSQYSFRHALLRDVTYESVLLSLRRRYHAVVADWLLENAGDRAPEFAPLLAEHYMRAGLRERAVPWLLRSAGSYNATGDFREALEACETALEIAGGGLAPGERAAAMLGRARALEKLGRYREAEGVLEAVLDLTGREGLDSLRSEAHGVLAWICNVTGRRGMMTGHVRAAFEAAQLSGGRRVLARAVMHMADLEEDRSPESIVPYYERCLALYAEIGDDQGRAITLLNLGNYLCRAGLREEAERAYRESRGLYESLGNRWGLANCLNNLGNIALEREEADEGLRLYRESLGLAESIGDVELAVICNLNLGRTNLGTGNRDCALEHLRRAIGRALSVGLVPLALASACQLCELLELRGMELEAGFGLTAILSSDCPPTEEDAARLAREAERLLRGADGATLERIRERAGAMTAERLCETLLAFADGARLE